MFKKFKTSWQLAGESFQVLKQDKELMVFPVLSTIMTALLLASFFVPVFTMIDWQSLSLDETTTNIVASGLLFMVYFIGYFVVLFCNTALLHCAKIRFEGGDPTVMDGMRAGMNNLSRIFYWAAIGGTLGVVLAQVEQRLGFVGTWIRRLVGGAWTVITYFAVPVLIFEQVPPGEAIKRSKDIIYKTWGEAAAAAVGMRAAQSVFSVLGLFVLIGSGVAAISFEQLHVFTGGAVVAFVIWIGSAIVFSCLAQIFRAALYIYATTNEPPKAFQLENLESAFG